LVAGIKVNTDNKSKLDSLIKRFVSEPKPKYVYEENIARKSFVDKSVQKLVDNSIIEGYFPKENLVKDMAIKRVNKSLCIILSILVAVVVISYYFVISCEIKLNDLSRQTVILNNENEELQNKLDSLKSFNNVDKTLQQNNLLQRPGQVIETPEIQATSENYGKNTSRKKVFNHAIGF
jgi:hypothetical protein